MRSSMLPTLALAILVLAAGAFGTWYMLAFDEEPARGPALDVAAEEKPAAELAPRADQPVDRPVTLPKEEPVKTETPAPSPKVGDVEKPTVAPAGEVRPGTRALPEGMDPEKMKEAMAKLEEELKNGRIRLGGDGEDFENIFNGPKVDFTATISGTVADTNGVPVAGAGVYGEFSETLEQGDGENRRVSIAIARSGEADRGKPLATTDAAGNFTATINRQVSEKLSVSVRLTAGAEGFGDSKSQRVALKNGDTKEGIKLVLRGAGSVSGRVVDSSGRGVEGVKVTIGGGEGFVVMGEGDMEMPERGSTKSATTDASGGFVVTGLPEGRYKPRLRATGWRQVSGPTEVTVKTGVDTKCPADFVMAAAAAVKVKVIGPEGKPVQGYASVRFKDGTNLLKTMAGGLNAEGALSLNDTPTGSLTVEIRVHGFKPQTVNATIVDGQVCDLGTVTVELGGDDEDMGVYFPGD